ncbi:MAG TPA: alpha/beta hydrolase [Acidimicrobiales bacterium]|nr:alpha/beta hydrolase [Acidimicrobiales bacterium]
MIVFVHGVPETAAMWRKVRAAIDGKSVALSLPGFGCPVPDGFGGTKDDYVAWLLDELGRIDGPVDLVGHDWGAGLAYRVVTAHGDRVRSWVADVGNIAHRDYEWHDFAKLWQTPGEGEAFVEAQNAATPEERAPLFEAMGVPHDDAMEMAAASDATMGACILSLYRSALPNPYSAWGPWTPTAAPGLVLHPTDDPFGDEALAAEVAEQLGARFERLEGVGHFWPYQAPEQAAAVLQEFWASVR